MNWQKLSKQPDPPLSVEQINELCSTINNILEDFGRFEEKNPLMGMGLLGMNLESGENTGK